MKGERLVFDTNVIISALMFPESKPGRAFFLTLASEIVLISDELVAELQRVFARPKFDRYVSPDDRAALLERLIDEGDLTPITVTVQVCRDPKDNHILELGVSGSATTIVSGDKDLLILGSFEGIPIRTPDDFLASRAPDAHP